MKIQTNIGIEKDLWIKAKKACIDRGISLSALVSNGLHLVLDHENTIVVDSNGKVENDYRGIFKPKM